LTNYRQQCHKVPRQECRDFPQKNCKKINVQKNRYVKRKQCQKCHKSTKTTYREITKNNCQIVPRKECRTFYYNDCDKEPFQKCQTVYGKKCGYEKECSTSYKKKCTKPKPAYGAPSYGAPKPSCTQIPVQNCRNVKKCIKVPKEKCTTAYKLNCHKVPKEKCRTIKELKCNPTKESIPQYQTQRSCSWPAKKGDQWCTRRSDDDVFLDESSDYSHSGEYLDGYMETPIDYVEVFPDNFHGSPNLTVTPDGRRFRPQYRADVLVVDDVYDEDLYDDDDGYRGSSFLHNQAPYDAAQSQALAFREVPSPDLSKIPPPHSSSFDDKLVQDNSQSFFPEEAKSQDNQEYRTIEEEKLFTDNGDGVFDNTHFGNFEQKVGKISKDEEQAVVEDDTKKIDKQKFAKVENDDKPISGSMKEDFDASFNPGFKNFGDFGGQSSASVLWGLKKD